MPPKSLAQDPGFQPRDIRGPLDVISQKMDITEHLFGLGKVSLWGNDLLLHLHLPLIIYLTKVTVWDPRILLDGMGFVPQRMFDTRDKTYSIYRVCTRMCAQIHF